MASPPGDHSRPALSAAATRAPLCASGSPHSRELVEKAVAERTSQLQAAVKALEVARNRLERAQSVANLGDLEIDLDSGERVWSSQLCRLFGFDPALGTPSLEQSLARIHPDDLPRVRRTLSEAMAGRGWSPEDARVLLPNGSIRWVRSVGENNRHADTGRRTVNVIMHDVTALKAAERELLANLERERELSQLRADFMNMVTHEYRTPLGIIMSSVEILERYFARLSAEDRASHLAEIRGGARRLADLVEEVLFLGKAEAGRVTLELRPLDLPAVLKKIASEVAATLGADRIVDIDIDRRLRGALLDQRLVSHIVTNLLGNALKYSTLDTEVQVRVRGDDTTVVIEIEDHGIGIPAADQGKLFQVFQRASNVGTISGSGLGLAIVKRCVDLHGGSVALRSEVGRGTCVTVRLPRSCAKKHSSHESNPNPRRGRRNAHAAEPRDHSKNGRLSRLRSPER